MADSRPHDSATQPGNVRIVPPTVTTAGAVDHAGSMTPSIAGGIQVPTAGAGDMEGDRNRRFLVFSALPAWLVSMIIHVIAIVCLALITMPHPVEQIKQALQLGTADTTPVDEAPLAAAPGEQPQELTSDVATFSANQPVNAAPAELEVRTDAAFDASDLDAAASTTELDPLGDRVGPRADLMTRVGVSGGQGLEGRGQANRARLVREGGGTEGSEKSVQLALQWIKRHQNPDGSWSFQHLNGRCDCPDAGSLTQAYRGATAMALLPFLGAGNTHKEGNYQREVQTGLYYLLSHQKPDGSFTEPGGNLYSHGLAAIVLSETYAMTQDQALLRPAQAALDYIAFAQDPTGGGWRYVARDPSGGDTSVMGWQLMAMKSGRMAYLNVNDAVLNGASRFLDSVQVDGGSAYGYMTPGDRPSTSAIGLLCRMYLGWERDNPALQRGVERLSRSGPSDVDMYYNYYATQVMRHYEGKHWEKWNAKMRDDLIAWQEKKGHQAGSWFMGKGHSSDTGGRLYCTSMATMILEVYYRHLPLYRQQATDDDFKF